MNRRVVRHGAPRPSRYTCTAVDVTVRRDFRHLRVRFRGRAPQSLRRLSVVRVVRTIQATGMVVVRYQEPQTVASAWDRAGSPGVCHRDPAERLTSVECGCLAVSPLGRDRAVYGRQSGGRLDLARLPGEVDRGMPAGRHV